MYVTPVKLVGFNSASVNAHPCLDAPVEDLKVH